MEKLAYPRSAIQLREFVRASLPAELEHGDESSSLEKRYFYHQKLIVVHFEDVKHDLDFSFVVINCILTGILACHDDKLCIFSKQIASVEAGFISQVLRIGASKWRYLATKEENRRHLFSTAIHSMNSTTMPIIR